MSESIFTLYNDEKFDKVLYYLSERGFVTLDTLIHFNFNELIFVPGISEDLLNEAKQIFSGCNFQTTITEEFSVTQELASVEILEPITNISYGDNISNANEIECIPPQVALIRDSFIADVYFNLPRSSPFIQKCKINGKSLMSQLTETDFEEAKNLRGIGVSSAEKLRKVYLDFVDSASSTKNTPFDDEPQCFTNLFNNLPLSERAKNCLKQHGVTSLHELLSLSEEELMHIRNMGVKTLNEILSFRNTISLSDIDSSKLYYLENIDPENAPIPIALLHNFGIPKQKIDQFRKSGLFTVRDLVSRGLTPQEYSYARIIKGALSVPVTKQFIDAVSALKDSAKISLSMRCKGSTLEEIGIALHLTRERARQIIAKTCRRLTGIADLVAGVLLSSERTSFSYSDLINFFSSEESAMFCKLVLQESEYVTYMKFADKFVEVSTCGSDIENRLKVYRDEIIGVGINFYDNLELIDSELKKYNLDFFDVFDIMNYLVHNKYRFYGDYVSRGVQPYLIYCYDAVCKFFKFDIKLDSDDKNEDMRLLRQIIAKHYHGVTLPSNNRALTAGITRDNSKLILSGRGRYCPIEKVIYSVSLFEEIRDFITKSSQSSFYYSELFSHFQGRFMAETNINNSNFLHGMLKCLYPNEFSYERDLMSKIGENRQDINDRLSHLLLQNGKAMTRTEIKHTIPGVNDFVISFSIIRQPELIQWDYNEFNHIGNIKVTNEEHGILSEVIKNQTKLHNGYTSDTLFFNATKDVCGDFLKKNNIRNSQNLFYIVAYLFKDEYRFKRPHILSKAFPVQDIVATKIVQVLLHCDIDLNYEKFTRLATELGWAGGTVYTIFSELEKDFIRVSENDYVRKDYFGISQSLLNAISDILRAFVSNSGYFAFSSIFNYETFPKFLYVWNGFLLESLISEFDTGFKIISPQIRDRRYQRGIIVSSESSINSFEELVIENLLTDGITTINEVDLLKYLKMNGLITTNSIPQEMYECPDLLFKNEFFTVKK